MNKDKNIPNEVSEYMRKIGKKGGAVKSEKKASTARDNGKKGGRKKCLKD